MFLILSFSQLRVLSVKNEEDRIRNQSMLVKDLNDQMRDLTLRSNIFGRGYDIYHI